LESEDFELVLVLWQDSEVSAFCCTREAFFVNSNVPATRNPSVTARPTHAEKQRFVEIAASRGISESALALIAIRAVLESDGSAIGTESASSGRQPATDRITIRLRPGDRLALDERAARRGIRSSTYLAALARAHIAASPPLTIDELTILKQGVAVLAKLNRSLAHTARCVAQSGVPSPELQKELSLTRTVVSALEQRTHDLARSALMTWESRYD
jgi:hypothetical protein